MQARRYPDKEFFKIFPDGAIAEAQKKELAMLCMKRTLADLVHDYGKKFLDEAIDTDTLIPIIGAGYPLLSPADKVELRTFFTNCSTDAMAKKNFKYEMQKYVNRYNIQENLGSKYYISTDDEPGSETELWERLRALNGGAAMYYLLDAQTGNPLKTYEYYRREPLVAGGQVVLPNNLCNDLSVKADPGSKWGGDKLVNVVNKYDTLTFPGREMGVGANYKLENAPPYIRASWLNPADDQEILPPREIDNNNNSIESLKGSILELPNDTPDGKKKRVLLLLAKPSGDANQVYTATSTLWGDVVLIFVTNDILCFELYKMCNGGVGLVTGPTELTLYNYGIAAETHLSVVDTNLIIPGKITPDGNLGDYINQQIAIFDGMIDNYFINIFSGLANGYVPKFLNSAEDPAGVLKILDNGKYYRVEFTNNPANKLAAIFGFMLDTIEKCYLYDLYIEKKRVLIEDFVYGEIIDGVQTRKDCRVDRTADGRLPIKYRIINNLAEYLGVSDFFKPKVIQREINAIFSAYVNISDSKKLYDELVNAFTKFVTASNVPKYLISAFMMSIYLASTMPPIPQRVMQRRKAMYDELVIEVTNRNTYIKGVLSDIELKKLMWLIGKDKLKKADNTYFPEDHGNSAEFAAAEFIGTSYNDTINWFTRIIVNIIRICFKTGIAISGGGAVAITRTQNIALAEDTIKDIQPPRVLELLTNFTNTSNKIEGIVKEEALKIDKEDAKDDTFNELLSTAAVNIMTKTRTLPLFKQKEKKKSRSQGWRGKKGRPVKTARNLIQSAKKAGRFNSGRISGVTVYGEKVSIEVLSTKKRGGGDIEDIENRIYEQLDAIGYMNLFDNNVDDESSIDIPEEFERIEAYIDKFDQFVAAISDKDIPKTEDIIYTFQNLVSESTSIAYDLNEDKEAYLVYALPAMLRFSSIRDPNMIITEYAVLKDHPYISNSVLPLAHGVDVYDAVASVLKDYTYKTVEEVKAEHTTAVKDIIKSLFMYTDQGKEVYIPDDEVLELVPFLNAIKTDFKFVPNFHRYYGVDQGDIAGIVDGVVREVLADSTFMASSDIRTKLESLVGVMHEEILITKKPTQNISLNIAEPQTPIKTAATPNYSSNLPQKLITTIPHEDENPLPLAVRGGRRKSRRATRRRRHSRRKSNRRSQSRPRRTQRRNRRDRIRHEE